MFIFIAFFGLIWGLTYVFHKTKLNIISWLIWFTSILLLNASAYYIVIDGLYKNQTHALGQNLEGMSNTMGTFSFLWGLAAVFILFSKHLFQRLHKKPGNEREVVRRILLLVKDHHNLFGWVTLIAASAHGIYFLFHTPNSWFEFYSGVAAWIALVLLAISGMWMINVVKIPKRAKAIRVSHIALTIGYAGTIELHFRGSMILAVLLFAAAFVGIGLMWIIVRFTQSLKHN
jgi:hypothetical protein